jgi:hypothetical protein
MNMPVRALSRQESIHIRASRHDESMSWSMGWSMMSILQHNALDVSKDYCQIIPVHITNDSL